MDEKDFLLWELASRDSIDFKKIYVDMSNDLISGLLLSQIIYWHLPSKETGKSKLRVNKENHYWIAKGRNDWWDEIRITAKQYDRAIKILEKLEIVEVKTFKFNGDPMKHVRLVWDKFLALLGEKMEAQALGDMVIPQRVKTNLPKGEKGNIPNGNKEIDQRGNSLTKITDKDFDIDLNNITTTSNRDKIDNDLKKQFPNVDYELAKEQAFEQFEIKTDKQYYASVYMKLIDLTKPKKKKAPPIRKELVPSWLNEEEEKPQPKQPEMTLEQFEIEKAKLMERIKKSKAQKEA